MKKWFFIVLAVTVVIVGAFAFFKNGGEDRITAEREIPTPKVTVGGKEIPTVLGSRVTDAIYDTAGALDLMKNQEPTAVISGAEISVAFDVVPGTLVLQRLDTEGNVVSEENLKQLKVFVVPSEKGVYVYNLNAWWKPIGSANFAFKIKVD
ncbi:hypothetical protein [Paenibacillus sp. LHD-38]|uniref:hypothetical protein n=1 Tax=Paenibacillus sp. LHD-38 TaxID=3072143 RepID=UPI00280C6FA5|nr:hypothetical protein [Paenibacillus sp. LHD-38]MDQ8738240.1 hypothetical protein [Paenibacillus sp. LHD-38]